MIGVRELSQGQHLHLLLLPRRLAWKAAINRARTRGIHLTEDLLPAFDIQQQLAAHLLEAATAQHRSVDSLNNPSDHGLVVLVQMRKDHNVLEPRLCRSFYHFPLICTLQPVMRRPWTTSRTHHVLAPDVMRLDIKVPYKVLYVPLARTQGNLNFTVHTA